MPPLISFLLLSAIFAAAGDGTSGFDTGLRAWVLTTLFGAVSIISTTTILVLAVESYPLLYVCDGCTTLALRNSMATPVLRALLSSIIVASEMTAAGYFAGYEMDWVLVIVAVRLNVAAWRIQQYREKQAKTARWKALRAKWAPELEAFRAKDAQERMAFVTAMDRLLRW